MIEPLNHKLDVSKIKTLTDVKNVFECMNLYSYAEEDHEKYELLKEYFTIPNEAQEIKFELPRKSLEEISQEFDEKIDKHIRVSSISLLNSNVIKSITTIKSSIELLRTLSMRRNTDNSQSDLQ